MPVQYYLLYLQQYGINVVDVLDLCSKHWCKCIAMYLCTTFLFPNLFVRVMFSGFR